MLQEREIRFYSGNGLVQLAYVQPVAQLKVLCGPVKVLAAVKVSYILTTNLYFDHLEFNIFGAVSLQCRFITSVAIQLAFERFQYISSSQIWFAKIKVSHSIRGPH